MRHRGLDAGVSVVGLAAGVDSPFAVPHKLLPVGWVLLEEQLEVLLAHGCWMLMRHTGPQKRVQQRHVLHTRCWQVWEVDLARLLPETGLSWLQVKRFEVVGVLQALLQHFVNWL